MTFSWTMQHAHPVFSWFWETIGTPTDRFGLGRARAHLVSRLSGRILEVGAGNGLNFQHYSPAATLIALEPDPCMLRRAVPRAEAAAGRVMLLAADGETLPFRSASFDAVVSCLVLCTISDPAASLAEMRRVLRPDGVLHFLEHVRAPARLLATLQDAIDPAWARMFAGCHPNRDTRAAIESAGFRIRKIATRVGGLVIRGQALAT